MHLSHQSVFFWSQFDFQQVVVVVLVVVWTLRSTQSSTAVRPSLATFQSPGCCLGYTTTGQGLHLTCAMEEVTCYSEYHPNDTFLTLIFSYLSSTSCSQDMNCRPLYRERTFLSFSSWKIQRLAIEFHRLWLRWFGNLVLIFVTVGFES
jgi:hypothetical protein